MQRKILEWARARVAAGGAPVTIRIVKGANLEMERVEASLRDWPQAPFERKVETDANYQRMLEEALRRKISPRRASTSHRTISSTWPTAL